MEGFIHGGAYFRNFMVSTMYFSACSTILFKNVEQVMFKQLSRKLSLCYILRVVDFLDRSVGVLTSPGSNHSTFFIIAFRPLQTKHLFPT